jgi:hypothetical protein
MFQGKENLEISREGYSSPESNLAFHLTLSKGNKIGNCVGT